MTQEEFLVRRQENRVRHLKNGVTVIKVLAQSGKTYNCILDTTDYELVKAHGPWYAREEITFGWFRILKYGLGNLVYVYSTKPPYTAIHRLILGLKRGDGIVTDHWDHNGLNNRRRNLRPGTLTDNGKNNIHTYMKGMKESQC